jgi:hypothetical protein
MHLARRLMGLSFSLILHVFFLSSFNQSINFFYRANKSSTREQKGKVNLIAPSAKVSNSWRANKFQ